MFRTRFHIRKFINIVVPSILSTISISVLDVYRDVLVCSNISVIRTWRPVGRCFYFSPKKKCGFFVQWPFETGSWMFYKISYLTESYRFCKVKLQKEIILSDFRFENHLIWKVEWTKNPHFFFGVFRVPTHLPTGRHVQISSLFAKREA